MNVYEFARAVDRIRYSPWCPTCGCTRVRWAGCSNAWHAIHAEHMFPCYCDDTAIANDPGAASTAPGPAKEGWFPRMDDITPSVNPSREAGEQ